MSLPAALQGFTKYPHFISYKLVPSTRPGKTDKVPLDWQTGKTADPHDPNTWAPDYNTAYACGGTLAGYVFTDDDPFWFLDIDDCWNGTAWSPLALEVCAMLPGAAIEISQSGHGLHLFGTGKIPPHSCRAPGLELYHTKRFVALGDRPGASGDCMTDCTAGITAVVEKYFTKANTPEDPPEWSNTPASDWRGPADDDELIRRACNSKSAAGAFGTKASFSQLWDADPIALAKAYPDAGGRDYDHSSADAALAQHLAFWTGKNPERIRTLMQRSRLKREKWSERGDYYLTRTILNACSMQRDVLQDKPMEAPAALITTTQAVQGNVYLTPADQTLFFAGYVYVAEDKRIISPGGITFEKEVLDDMLGGFVFILDKENNKTTTSAWDAFTQSRALRHPKVNATSFRPDLAPGAIWLEDNKSFVNAYWPIEPRKAEGSAAPFVEHLAKLLPDWNDRQILLSYMAAIVQYPGVKFHWCPLIQGVEGNGKSLLSSCIMAAVGHQYSHMVTNSSEITEKYNKWALNKIFIGVEDIFVPKDKMEVMEILKTLTTTSTLEIRGMGQDKVNRRVCGNFILNSNHKDAIRKTDRDRRYCPLFTAQQEASDLARDGMDGSYFMDLYRWAERDGYAIVAQYLRDFKIPEELNPATLCQRAPLTTSTTEAIDESKSTIDQEILAAIAEDRPGFRGGWISSHWLSLLVKEVSGRTIPRNKFSEKLQDLGYVPHPGLLDGRVNNPPAYDPIKSRLYVTKKHPSLGLTGAAVGHAYSEAQTAQVAFKVVG